MLAFWQQVVVLVTGILTLLTALISAATGIIRPTGGSIFGSPIFWSFYALLLITVFTVIVDMIALVMQRRRHLSRGFMVWGHKVNAGVYVISNLTFLLLFVPYVFGIGALAQEAATNGPNDARGVGCRRRRAVRRILGGPDGICCG